MTATLIIAAAGAAATLALLAAAPAHADMSLGMQDDEACKYHKDADENVLLGPSAEWLQRVDTVHAEWVRVMVPHGRWQAESAAIVACARDAQASGHKVFAALFNWNQRPTAGEQRAFAEEVVPSLAPYVDAWSPHNEPTEPMFAPWTGTRCAVTSDVSTGAKTEPGTRVRGWRKVRRRHGTHRRIVRHRAHRVIVRFKRAHGKRARWRRTSKRAPGRIVYVTNGTERHACTNETFARAYRRLWDQVAPVIRGHDPDSQLVVGDIYTDPIEFMETFYGDEPLKVRPDVLGTHYSDPAASAGYVAYARRHGMDQWETEWGLGQHGNSAAPAEWTRALAEFERAGVAVTFIYDTVSPGWDTQMTAGAFEAVANR